MSDGPVSKRGSEPMRAGMSRGSRRALVATAWTIGSLTFFLALAYAFNRFVLHAPNPTLAWFHKGTQYELLNPKSLALVLGIPLLLIALPISLADLPWPQRVLSLLLRSAFVILVTLGLAQPSRTATTEKACTVYIVDVSNSIPNEALGDAKAIIESAIKEKPPEGLVKIITFARRPRVVEPSKDGTIEIARHGDPKANGQPGDDGAGTNIQAALQLAYGLYPSGYLKRAVILSDGVQTDGDLLAEANRAKDFGLHVFTIPYTRPVPGEVAVQALKMPDHVKVGDAFDIHASIYASRATKAKGKLYQDDALNGLDGAKDIDLKAGLNDVVWKTVDHYAGPITYKLELSDIADDTFPDNNQAAATIDVPGRATVLYVEGTPENAQPLSNALTAQQFDVDVRPPVGFPGSLQELGRFDFVIVSDTPKDAMSLEAQELIQQYVTDGGGFLFAGGEAGYGLGGWYHTTMEKILPVRMENKAKEEEPGVAMTLIIDRSGSMTGLKLEMAKAAAKATAETLGPSDLLEVIAFDTNPTRFVKLQPARNRSRILSDISRIQPGGGTDIFTALDAGYQDMSVAQARKKHVILLTDGIAPSDGIADLVTAMVNDQITLSTVAVGDDADEKLLGTMAHSGGGTFYPVSDPNNLPKIFTKETEMISHDAAVEEYFPVHQTGDAQFLHGLDVRTAPNLHGYVSTEMKASPAEQILASDKDEPILARWRYGLGWSLAWTSDVKAKWAVEWLPPHWTWEQFWGQLVREHMRQKHQRELDMKAEIVDGHLRASVDAFKPADDGSGEEQFENYLTSKLTITGPEPKGAAEVVTMRQIAPGRYEADVPMDKYGSFLLKAEHIRTEDDGTEKVTAVSYGHVSNPYPREYASFEPNRDLLEKTAIATDATMNPESVKDVFDPRGEKITFHDPLWSKFIFAAIGVFLADLFVRRVRLFDRKFVARPRRA